MVLAVVVVVVAAVAVAVAVVVVVTSSRSRRSRRRRSRSCRRSSKRRRRSSRTGSSISGSSTMCGCRSCFRCLQDQDKVGLGSDTSGRGCGDSAHLQAATASLGEVSTASRWRLGEGFGCRAL